MSDKCYTCERWDSDICPNCSELGGSKDHFKPIILAKLYVKLIGILETLDRIEKTLIQITPKNPSKKAKKLTKLERTIKIQNDIEVDLL